MKNRTKSSLYLLAGAYLIYLGIRTIKDFQHILGKIIGVVFALCGTLCLLYFIKVNKKNKKELEEQEDESRNGI